MLPHAASSHAVSRQAPPFLRLAEQATGSDLQGNCRAQLADTTSTSVEMGTTAWPKHGKICMHAPDGQEAAHHAGPGLDLALPVAKRGEGRDDDVRAPHAQELALKRQRADALRSLAQPLRVEEQSQVSLSCKRSSSTHRHHFWCMCGIHLGSHCPRRA